ncbi:MAG: CDP-glucose 4,6-dehydratase [Ferruginibacter sp.]
MVFNNVYRGKKVLITGNTGFKGCWLSIWLYELGAEVYGYSKDVPTQPSMFESLDLAKKITHTFGDIRDKAALQACVEEIQPNFIFHLAAQAIVSASYSDPLETISTNVLGTAVVLDVIKTINHPCVCVMITSDKAYDNVEWIWGYRENDRLGGKDVYSGSKGAAELIIKSYWQSFISKNKNIKMATVRAGNVIGGGDWSADRIVVDCIKSFVDQKPVELRSPSATRPWQHVLEPLSGYLNTGQALYEGTIANAEAFNFGPASEQIRTVYELSSQIALRWSGSIEGLIEVTDNIPFEEATLLKLNCDKALAQIGWTSTLDFTTMLDYIVSWYRMYFDDPASLFELTRQQIHAYEEVAINKKIKWTS